MNAVYRRILEAVRDDKVTPSCRHLARHLLDKEDRRAALAAARSCTTEHVAKQAVASIEHHRKARRAEERVLEETSEETWQVCLSRTLVDHGLFHSCEACHRSVGHRELEPHHLEMGSGNRRDAPEVVMALCAGCHRLNPNSAHRAVRLFAQVVVIPWLKAHGYPLVNRKEYRDA